MPELPEVEIVSTDLFSKVASDTIVSVDVRFAKLLKNIDAFQFATELIPFSLTAIKRVGKYILFHDAAASKWMTVHLGMTGAFFVASDTDEIPPKFQNHQHVLFGLASGRTMVYCDIRKFGDIRFFSENPDLTYEPFRKLGPDPLNEPDPEKFLLNARSKLFAHKEIKPSLLDSRLVAGVGNIYACEVLFSNQIHPLTLCVDLTDQQLTDLYASIREIFLFSIAQGGSSVSDYVNAEGVKGEFQNFHKIYQKSVCSVCSTDIAKITQNKRSTFFCPTCQSFSKGNEENH